VTQNKQIPKIKN